jgi:uncharacterized protein YxjI
MTGAWLSAAAGCTRRAIMDCMPYLVQDRILSSGGNFWVTDEQGKQVYLVSAQTLGVSQTFDLRDSSGAFVASIRKERWTSRDTMDIERDGAVIATVQPVVFSPVHHRTVINLAGKGEMEAIGNFLGREFEIRSGDAVLAKITRSLLNDRYSVDVSPGQDDALILAIAISMDRIDVDKEAEREAAQREHTATFIPPPGR